MAKTVNQPILSFFTGGGFLDAGFESAGFNIIWTNEHNTVFAKMYETGYSAWRKSYMPNCAAAKISCTKDIMEINSNTLLKSVFGSPKPDLFGVIGGPPCPDFSTGGKNSGHTGSNGKLTKIFVDTILTLKPTFFVIENVPGLFRTLKHRKFLDKITTRLRNEGYVVDRALLNALEYGVPQDRERLFVVGIRYRYYKRFVSNSIPTDDGWFTWPKKKYPDAKHAFEWPTQNPFGSQPTKPDNSPRQLMVNDCLINLENVPNSEDCYKPKSDKFWVRDEGDTSRMSFKRLHRFRYSPTMWFGNNEVHLHPWLPRRLSVREAMRIQSIPDSYVLPSDVSLEAKFKMVGNGVPYLLGKCVAEALMEFLKKSH